jgi:hypothetical protein
MELCMLETVLEKTGQSHGIILSSKDETADADDGSGDEL